MQISLSIRSIGRDGRCNKARTSLQIHQKQSLQALGISSSDSHTKSREHAQDKRLWNTIAAVE